MAKDHPLIVFEQQDHGEAPQIHGKAKISRRKAREIKRIASRRIQQRQAAASTAHAASITATTNILNLPQTAPVQAGSLQTHVRSHTELRATVSRPSAQTRCRRARPRRRRFRKLGWRLRVGSRRSHPLPTTVMCLCSALRRLQPVALCRQCCINHRPRVYRALM